MPSPLADLRVLDLSWGLSGPVAAMLLADYGADVLKVEPPTGDPYSETAGYRVWQRGKRRTQLDLSGPNGRTALMALAREADVLIESYAPGVAARLGVDYPDLAAENPRLIYTSITGYGRSGPWSERPGYDILVNARLGTYADQPGQRDGPIFLATPTGAYAAAWLAVTGIGAALHYRAQTGQGQHVQTSLMQGALVYNLMLWQRADEPLLKAIGHGSWVPTLFECADGRWIHVMPQQHKHDLAKLLDLPTSEAGGLTPSARGTPGNAEYRLALNALAAERIKEKPSEHWLNFFRGVDAPIMLVQSAEEALDAPQIRLNGMVATVADPVCGPLKQIGLPIRLDRSPGAILGGPAAKAGAAEWSSRSESPDPPIAPNPAAAPYPGPLAGLRVLDFGHFLAGPYGPQIMADLGADVIKIERLDGDPMRPVDFAFLGCQRNKRSLAIELKDPAAQEIVDRLIATADVLHHNMRPGAAERIGIGYETARRINPGLIYCHTPAFGIEGEWAGLPGLDQIFQAYCGCEQYNGGEGNPPMYNRQGAVDFANALLSINGVMMALRHRDRTGEGQFLTGSLMNAGLFFNSDAIVGGPDAPQRPQLDHDQTGFGPLYRLYETAEGWIAIAAAQPAEWAALVRALERSDLGADPRFATPEARSVNAAALAEMLAAAFKAHTAEDWLERLDAAGAPAERADLSYEYDFFDDPAMLERDLVASYAHPRFGRLRNPGLLIDCSATPGAIRLGPPVLGEHSREILAELGYDERTIEEWRAKGLIAWE